MMSDSPLAYHITIGTYGTRLHGDDRGTVDRRMNRPGDPIIGHNDAWEQIERSRLKFDPVRFTDPQRAVAEAIVPDVCRRGGWTYHITAARVDHIHVLLSAAADGKSVRRWLKTWLGQGMTERWPLPDGATWWAECGSAKWVWTQDYFDNVMDYIARQRMTPLKT